MLPSPSHHARKTTYLRNTWNSGHLYLILLAVLRVVGKGFCSGPDVLGPKQNALCSEALHEDAVILPHV
jgi:hypothetical protein